VIAIEPLGKAPWASRSATPTRSVTKEIYFGDTTDKKILKDMLDLAVEIIRSKIQHFQPDKSEDLYESALRDLIGKKQRGEKSKVRKRPQAQTIDLMGPLRRSARKPTIDAACARCFPWDSGRVKVEQAHNPAGRADGALRWQGQKTKIETNRRRK
jgi:non-homologous end joining protein Ku